MADGLEVSGIGDISWKFEACDLLSIMYFKEEQCYSVLCAYSTNEMALKGTIDRDDRDKDSPYIDGLPAIEFRSSAHFESRLLGKFNYYGWVGWGGRGGLSPDKFVRGCIRVLACRTSNWFLCSRKSEG